MKWLPSKDEIAALKDKMSKVVDDTAENIKSIDIQKKAEALKSGAASAAESTVESVSKAYTTGVGAAVDGYNAAANTLSEVDYREYMKYEYYKNSFSKYSDIGSEKVVAYFRTTFEVDKDTLKMVEDVKSTMPVPAESIDDIFSQCKTEAMRRAISSFALHGAMSSLDSHSAEKYENLSETYREFSDRVGHSMFDDKNFSDMKDARYEAKANWTLLENGYNKKSPLDPLSTDIEHVVARKDYFEDLLLRVGTTDDDFFSVVNSKENLVFADASLNRAMQDKNTLAYIRDNGTPNAGDPDLIDITIKSTGEVKTVSRSDVEKALSTAEENRASHRMDAAVELASTVVSTGAMMAAQQVIGLIVVETIDVFVDELKHATTSGEFVKDGKLAENSKVIVDRIHTKLSERIEQRNLWQRAKDLGMESGVAGALSVIPQVLVSMLTKLPSFVIAIIRECTLSLVRCLRLLYSKVENKLDSIMVILAGAVSAIVGVYISKLLNTAFASIPVLDKFAPQITNILAGVLVFAVPLAAIYVFDQNKGSLQFALRRMTGGAEEGGTELRDAGVNDGPPPAPAL